MDTLLVPLCQHYDARGKEDPCDGCPGMNAPGGCIDDPDLCRVQGARYPYNGQY
jgi:hypothetical protein